MALSTGSNKIKTAIFISGTGSNLRSLIKFSKLKKSPIIIKMIVSNNPQAKGLRYSKIYKIKKKVFDFENFLSEKKAINELKKNNIDLICLAGFMKILSKRFIKNFRGKILKVSVEHKKFSFEVSGDEPLTIIVNGQSTIVEPNFSIAS